MPQRMLSRVLTAAVAITVMLVSTPAAYAAPSVATDPDASLQRSGGREASGAETSDPGGPRADKSIAFYVGKNRTKNGHPLIGGFGHEPSGHWLEVVPRQTHPKGSTITVDATDES